MRADTVPHLKSVSADDDEEPHAEAARAGLTPAYLANLPQAQQKNILGEQLYKLIFATNPSQAGKITGMLLELDTSEVLHLIDTPAALTDKVSEAIEALKSANNAANLRAQYAKTASAVRSRKSRHPTLNP